MKILAASIIDAADQFLHAGYISAYPTTMTLEQLSYGDAPDVVINLNQALQLQDVASAGSTAETFLAGLGGLASPELIAAGAVTLAGVIGLSWLTKRGLKPALAAGLALSFGIIACEPLAEALPTDVPWEDVQIQDYADPEAATIAIQRALIAPALFNMAEPVEILPNIQYEVGLPSTNLTDGMAYAIQTYGLDGWGNEMKLDITDTGMTVDEEAETYTYVVTSSGADGSFDTDDDILITVQSGDEDWEYARLAYYINTDTDLFFHRWNGWRMEYRNEEAAKSATGQEIFDMFKAGELDADIKTQLEGYYDGVADSGDLVMIGF